MKGKPTPLHLEVLLPRTRVILRLEKHLRAANTLLLLVKLLRAATMLLLRAKPLTTQENPKGFREVCHGPRSRLQMPALANTSAIGLALTWVLHSVHFGVALMQ